MSHSRSQIIKVALALVLLALAAGLILSRRGGKGPQNVYYIDMATGQLRAAPDGDRSATRAHVYGCGACGEQDRRVLWISRHVDIAPAAPGDATAGPRSTQVAEPPTPGQEPAWVNLLDPRASKISAKAAALCSDNSAIECLP